MGTLELSTPLILTRVSVCGAKREKERKKVRREKDRERDREIER